MKGVKTELSDKAQAWIIKHFKHTKNAEIAARYGISETALHRFAREHGLKKTPQFQAKCQANASRIAQAHNYVHGVYPPKGYIIPRSEEFRFKPGMTPEQRLGKKRNEERKRKSAESRRKTWKLEHARVVFGLPQETRLRVKKQPREWALRRNYLRRLGYIVERGGLDVFYTPDTRRSAKLEAMPRPFRYAPISNICNS